MNKKYSILALFASCFLWFAFPNDPPNGNTGAPSEGTCASCHTLNGGTQDGVVTISGIPSSIEPCMSYTLTVTSSNPNGVASVAGFQLTILNGSNQIAGTMSGPSGGSTLQTSSGRQYWEHTTPATYPGSNLIEWTVNWKAPSSPANTVVTAYVANNVANNNGSDTGDLIVTGTATGTLNGGAPALTSSITGHTDVLCNGSNTGSATVTPGGGISPYTYNWSNGQTTQTINNLVAGNYVVTVTDGCGSTSTSSVSIAQPAALAFTSPNTTNVSCNGGSNGALTAHASGGISPYNYNWSNGMSGATISNLSAGAYTVTVTDNNACTKTTTYQITQPAVIVVNLVSLTNESCSGQEDGAISISVTGGVNPIFAEWSNGTIGTTIMDLAPDTYSVTVTDNNACTKTATFTVNGGGVVDVILNSSSNVSCPGGNNGSISVSATGGTGPYNYIWSNNQSGGSISNLPVGSYIVTATDSHGCNIVEGYTITGPQDFVISIQQTSQNLCFGASTADLQSVTTGGTSPYTAAWSNGVNGNNNMNVPAGTYTVTITDDNGCTSTKSAVVTAPAQVVVSVSTTPETGVGLNNGTATALPTGGTGAFTYLWSNGGTTATISGLPPATYTVTVNDANSCSSTMSAVVSAFGCLLNVTLPADINVCEGVPNVIQADVTGQSGSVTYTWSTGESSESITVTISGQYCVTVMDDSGCQDNDCIQVTVNPLPTFDCFVVSESSPGAMDGTITCTGDPGSTYIWSNGVTTPSLIGLIPGVYCVTVVNQFGCASDTCFNVQPGNCQLTITTSHTDVDCAGTNSGSITVTPNNATPPISYLWSNGDTTSSITNLVGGEYGVTVTDATGCFATDLVNVIDPAPIQIVIDSIGNISDFPDGYIHITVTGGVSPYAYDWLFPDGTHRPGSEDLDDLFLTGEYQLTVADANGCVVTSALITVIGGVGVHPTESVKLVKVFPVPTGDELFIDMEIPAAQVLISGLDGRLVKQFDHPANNKLNVAEIESGWYLVRIFDGNDWYVARIVK